MKLTEEILHKLIKEELLQEAAKGIQDIPEDHYVVCSALKNNNGFLISLQSRDDNLGWIQFENIPDKYGNCSGGMTISMSGAEKGWGPFLYDLVMEKATIESNGIIPDRSLVSPAARNVWEYYLNNREGILIRQLDDLNDSFENGPHDDCSQDSSQKHLQMNWKDSPLSKIYSKKPTTIAALKKIGKWKDPSSEKLTEAVLYDLIKELLENYGESETKFFGNGVAEIIEKGNDVYKNDKAFLNPAWIVKNVGRRIGAGYSREVYQIGDSNMVIKFALPEELKEGIQSNGFEVELFNQYPFVFPRTYIFDKSEGGPEWLVIEKVTVIEDGFEYDEIIELCYPSLVKAAQMFVDAGYEKVDASFLFERLLDSFEESEGSDVMGIWMDIIFHARRLKGGDDETKKKLAEDSWGVATNNADLMSFITTCLDLGVDFDEIREGNIGTNDEKNRLMLIDISKFQFVEA